MDDAEAANDRRFDAKKECAIIYKNLCAQAKGERRNKNDHAASISTVNTIIKC